MAVQQTFLNKDQYPSILEPKHIKEILGIGERQLYEFLNQNPAPFHFVRVGRCIKVSKEVFLNWLEGRSNYGA